MTVEELIKILKKFPKDTVVVYEKFSDYDLMEPGQVRLIKAEDKVIAYRNGAYTNVNPKWVPPGEVIDWVTVVAFPGN